MAHEPAMKNSEAAVWRVWLWLLVLPGLLFLGVLIFVEDRPAPFDALAFLLTPCLGLAGLISFCCGIFTHQRSWRRRHDMIMGTAAMVVGLPVLLLGYQKIRDAADRTH